MDDSQPPKNVLKATFFNELALQYNDILEIDKVYTFAGGDIKPKNTRYNSTKHDCEMVFNRNTVITSNADSKRIPRQKDDFELLSCIEKYEKYHELDVMVVVESVSDPEEVNLKLGGTKSKKNLKIWDESGLSIGLTVWGADIPGNE